MATRPSFRLLWQRPRGRFALLGLLLAGTATWYVHSRGGWGNTLRLPPVLDASTPRSQNGYTVTKVQLADFRAAAAYVTIRPPSLPKCTQDSKNEDDTYTYNPAPGSAAPIVQATGLTSSGDVTPLPWSIIGDADSPKFLRVEIPSGYSDACHFIDVSLVTTTGSFPRWRITRLPPMRQVIPDAPVITDHVTAGGITATATAWRSRHEIFCQVRPLLPPNSHQWELVTNDQWSEWEKLGQAHPQDVYASRPIEGRSGHFSVRDLAPNYGNLTRRFPADYRSASHFVRLSYELRQFETHDEAVTFHNLAVTQDKNGTFGDAKTYNLTVLHPITLTTPSGIAVTIPVQGIREHGDGMGASFNVQLTVKSTAVPAELPQSPLVRQFNKPIAISISFAPPQQVSSWSVKPGDTQTYSLELPINPVMETYQGRLRWLTNVKNHKHIPFYADIPPHLKNLTVIVRQRVEIQTIPMTFTVPVSDTPPAGFR